MRFLYLFFFQAEDGIRDIGVTGVQTCALPICGRQGCAPGPDPAKRAEVELPPGSELGRPAGNEERRRDAEVRHQIGRASCRERVYISVVAVLLKKNATSTMLLTLLASTVIIIH